MKKGLLLFVPLLLLAWLCPIPAALGTPTRLPTLANPAASTSLPTVAVKEPIASPTASLPPEPSVTQVAFMRVRLSPQDGDLPSQLQSEVLKAAALRLTPFVSFDASW
ncbi:MAG TPA: hypothetical protein VMC09_14810 [Anaerolineales bacterium]|nr:hypothetical protein [Anaerolineales bacterium]